MTSTRPPFHVRAHRITDKDYPDRVAHTLMHKLLGEFEQQHPRWATYKEDNCADGKFDWCVRACSLRSVKRILAV